MILLLLSGHYPMMIMFPLLPFFYFIFPIISLLISLFLLFRSTNKTIFKKVFLLIFIIPAVYTYLFPSIHHELKIRTTIPTESIVREYVDNYFAGVTPSLIRSKPLINYHAKTKELDIYLRIDPQNFLQIQEMENNQEILLPEEKGKYFVNRLIFEIFELPIKLNQKTTVPNTIHAYCYWGDTLISKVNYQKSSGQYKIVKPYPLLNLIGTNNSWFLQFEIDNKINKLFLKKEPRSEFIIKLEPLIEKLEK